VSGNPALRSAYPEPRVHASEAVDGALVGLLATSARESVGHLDDAQLPATIREDERADVATIRNGAALRPDVVISASASMRIGGRKLEVRLATDAVTAGDVWLYDERDRLAVLGDLVTLPAPFLDTACPEGWKAALERIEPTPFEIAIPGHGSPMTRAQFRVYRGALRAGGGRSRQCRQVPVEPLPNPQVQPQTPQAPVRALTVARHRARAARRGIRAGGTRRAWTSLTAHGCSARVPIPEWYA
jgi:glyoxylase-like metal-dependent hydrolase (beta-lactamase superfamily II)